MAPDQQDRNDRGSSGRRCTAALAARASPSQKVRLQLTSTLTISDHGRILLPIAPVIRDDACGEVDIVANNPVAPRCSQKFRERAFTGLVCSQRLNQRLAVKMVKTPTVPDANGAPMVTIGPSSVKYKL